ncbi:cysteine hydrolase [Roseibacterium sp. SDUM158016]|uniref:cysteine hydrolase family protein n=1 Tax=Roseicyclus sediminis TaxID=2980997 RepID=UPI0021D003D3|nr:cysteine hydrolase family protein [Roseibacterium sp. SDUM158016]MCU4654296.1 cysteine hydrolase [Roseibacterium sp. SDUM158016]
MGGKAGLILIDIQAGFDAASWGARNNPDAEDRAAGLLAHWRAARAPVVHIRHVSTEPGSPLSGPGTAFKDGVAPRGDEPVFEKSVNSAFIGTGLEAHLRDHGIADLVICGLTTPHCVSTTVRMAANLGFSVRVAHDACAAFARNADTGWRQGLAAMDPQAIHDAALSHLHGEFAEVVPVATLTERAP